MKNKLNLQAQKAGVLTFCLVFLISTFLPQLGLYRLPSEDSNNNSLAKVEENYGKVPLVFESNIGQTDEQVKFLNRAGNTTTYFTPTETVMVRSQNLGDKDDPELVSDVLRMSLNGANDNPEIVGLDEQQTKSNYFIGDDSTDWKSDITNYGKIKYSEVYPGIDMVYYGNNDNLEHDFVISPGTDPNQISFNLEGAKNASVNEDGNLVIKQDYGQTVLQKPISYQDKQLIETSYKVDGENVSFALADYDPRKELVIDPVVLVYSTYLGGSGSDVGIDIAVDSSGNAYVSGYTVSTDFPTSSPFQASNAGGGSDAFVAKLNPTGSALTYSTYLGGSGTDIGYSIAIDSFGNAYVSGRTDSTDFPTSSPFQGSSGGGGFNDAFVAKLNPTGSALTYSTYLGGSGAEVSLDIDVDNSGNAYVTGHTASTDFPTSSPFQASKSGGQDGFITKLNAAGSALTYSTYLGGSGTDDTQGITIDSSGNAYITGWTDSTDFPTASPYQGSYGGGNDAIVVKLNAAGSALTYSTYLGGSGWDIARSVTVDSSGNVYVIGHTASTDFPTSSPFQVSNAGGTYDSFITKLNAAGSALAYSTYLGGSGTDIGRNIAVDSSGNMYITGNTDSTDFPTNSPFQASNGGNDDAFVTKLNAAGSALAYSTYLGGSGTELGVGLALDLSGTVYINGRTDSADFPTNSPFQASFGGGTNDSFVSRITEHSVIVTGQVNPTLTFTVDDTSCDLGVISATSTGSCTHTMTAGTNASSGYVISYLPTATLTSGSDTITETGATGATSSQGSEQFGLNLKDNATPNIGAEATGGAGVASANYNTADTFSFTAAGAQVAESSTLSDTTTYTVSYIANVANTTEAGNYSTVQTYNIVASY